MNRNLLLFIVLIKVSFIHGNHKILNPVCIDSAGLSKQYHVVELTNEEIVYDAYQVKSEVAERTFIGEARMIFTDDNIVLEFELQDYRRKIKPIGDNLGTALGYHRESINSLHSRLLRPLSG